MTGTGGADDPRVQAGVEHLQRAAREVIAASRALLDVAEDLVDDPDAARQVANLLAPIGDLAARIGRPAGPRPSSGNRRGDDEPGDEDGEPPVQRIPVS